MHFRLIKSLIAVAAIIGSSNASPCKHSSYSASTTQQLSTSTAEPTRSTESLVVTLSDSTTSLSSTVETEVAISMTTSSEETTASTSAEATETSTTVEESSTTTQEDVEEPTTTAEPTATETSTEVVPTTTTTEEAPLITGSFYLVVRTQDAVDGLPLLARPRIAGAPTYFIAPPVSENEYSRADFTLQAETGYMKLNILDPAIQDLYLGTTSTNILYTVRTNQLPREPQIQSGYIVCQPPRVSQPIACVARGSERSSFIVQRGASFSVPRIVNDGQDVIGSVPMELIAMPV